MDKRPTHFLVKNVRQSRPKRVILFDTETSGVLVEDNERKQVLKLGWVVYWEQLSLAQEPKLEWGTFTTKGEFWEFVHRYVGPGPKLYIMAHNVAFDWRIVGGFEHVDKFGWKQTFFYHKYTTTILEYKAGGCTIQVLDTGNFFPVSLKVLGEIVGIEKGEIDFETCSLADLSSYCRKDVEILVRALGLWISFLDEHDLGDFKPTLASQAFAAYRHRFMPYPIRIHGNMTVCKLERESYHGARTEVFRQATFPTGRYYKLDVNGMYAHVMQKEEYPRLLKGNFDGISPTYLRRLLERYSVIARVVVKTEYPVFPLKPDDTNIYPTGTFETVLTTPELKFSLDNCEVLAIKEGVCYESGPIFREYSTYFSQLKEKYGRGANAPFRSIAKLFCNSLYGKFGQRGMKTTIAHDLPSMGPQEAMYYRHQTKKWCRLYRLGHTTVFETQSGESFNSFPAIPAHVTAYARLYLWELMAKASRENVFYCDTDSLIVNQRGYLNLRGCIHDHRRGYLKIEEKGKRLEIRAPKDYTLGTKAVVKGIRKNAKEVGVNTYSQDQFLGLRGAIRRGSPDLVTIKTIEKTLKREIRTGTVGKDGWVTPFRFPL